MGLPRNDPGQPVSGEALRLYRVANHLTVRDVAAALGKENYAVDHRTISRWEADEHTPPRVAVRLLAKLYRCRMRDLAEPLIQRRRGA